MLRLHEATVIDADRGYTPGTDVSADIHLEEGYHPIWLIYGRGSGDRSPSLQVQWSGPGFSIRPLDADRLSH